MLKENLDGCFSITFETCDVSPISEHTQHFFELIFIRSGTGTHSLNNGECAYVPGSLFLVTPADIHSFKIGTSTDFFFMKFNSSYFQRPNTPVPNIQMLEYVLENSNRNPDCVLKKIDDRSLTSSIVEALWKEKQIKDVYDTELIQLLAHSLIVIVARNISKNLEEYPAVRKDEKLGEIINYIQVNIYDPKCLSATAIGDVFAMSPNYIGKYFKNKTEKTMQAFINSYKANLIEHRLKHTSLRISEISNDFGFSDTSHINKFFRKQKGKSIKEVRRLAFN